MKRRDFIKTTAKGLGSALAYSHAPYIIAKTKTKLRVMGTHVTLQEELRKMAERDLGIELIFQPNGSAAVLQKAAADPSSFDLYEQWSNSINILWHSKSIQPIEVERIKNWKEINSLSKTGKIVPEAKIGLGDAPHKILYVQKDGTIGPNKTNQVTYLPYVHNVDSFGYNTDFIAEGKAYETESWSWLLDEKFKGKVAIVNAPTIGVFDLALAVQAKGLMSFKDMGNMTVKELDELFAIIMEYKQKGHFAGFWTSVPQSADYLIQKRVWIESMFSPGVSMARAKGIPVIYAAPKEGYRAWHGVMCLSSKTTDERVKNAAYDYMNWWLSGVPGAFIARQGYYISNPERSRPHMTKEEWDYWYEGRPARVGLKGTDGVVSVQAGDIRRGGSYIKRFSNIAVWNTVMKNYDYKLDKWYEFLNS